MNGLLRKSWFPVSLKIFNFLIFILLIWTGLHAFSSDPSELVFLRNTNLANLVVWSYWWPCIIAAAIFFGRIWCMVCPVELITSVFSRYGLKRRRPKWMMMGWGITLFYILILFAGIQVWQVHRNPGFMALYLVSILLVSVVAGLIYEKNTFCAYLCPIGYLLGIYARLSFIGWRVRDRSVCDQCIDKSCIRTDHHYAWNVKSCGVDLFPARINGNSECILCAGCLKACDQLQKKPVSGRPNPGWFHTGFGSDLMSIRPLKAAEVAFMFVVSGFIITEIGSERALVKELMERPARWFAEALGQSAPSLKGVIYGLVWFILVPLGIWFLPYLLARITRTRLYLSDYLFNYGLAFIPVMAAAHLDKAILKTTSRLPYFEHILKDIYGETTAGQLMKGMITLSRMPFAAEILISVLLMTIMIAGTALSVRLVTRLNRKYGFTVQQGMLFYLVPFVYGGFLLLVLFIWRV